MQSQASIRAVSILIGPTQSVHANPSSSVDGSKSFKACRSVMSFADAVIVMCGFTPPSIGPKPAPS
ncbi:hypothetical protein RERY_08430 [Rhodococcus erythropolis]|nr:hypothetical protein RERY_08430 [Rhodococcus erythropolis]